ncbi:hypothetical protein PYCCODRAFT_1192296 [Trametes coccinea BRFM310]|uniref:Uncharacterized protein n=1 Tax=Trametes coccinea (strain BRFM310) TaxID=1353009 RepID=A0A1Y2I7P4_TRAC3|nr:hypothetical protein PYCCODRAFT_1192296 [Trametes coccinea BRFM310]
MALSRLKEILTGRKIASGTTTPGPSASCPARQASVRPDDQVPTSSRLWCAPIVRLRFRSQRSASTTDCKDRPFVEGVPIKCSPQTVGAEHDVEVPRAVSVGKAKVQPEREHPPESLPGARQDPRPNTPVPESQSGPRRRCWPETVMNGLALALDVTEKAGAAFPPLQAVAGSLTVITKVVKKTCSNEDDLCALQSYVEQLNRIISPDTLPPSQDWPVAFNARVSNLASGLQKVQDRVVDLQSERSLERVLNVQERAGLMADCVRTLGQLVATFTMQGSITTELGINRVAFKVEETRQDITGQLKELLHASQNFLHQPGGKLRFLLIMPTS